MSEEQQELRKFVRGRNKKYSLKEKHGLGQLTKNTNHSIMIMLGRIKTELVTTICINDPQKNYQKKDTWQEQCENFKDVKHNDPDMWNALKLGKRCLDSLEANDFTEPPTKVKFRKAEGGRKKSVPEVCEAKYDWFIDIRSRLKARLPMSMFKAQCKIFYEQWLS